MVSDEKDYVLSEDGKTMSVDGRVVMGVTSKGAELMELHFRRTWAEKVRQEFASYHDHSAGECGACGAIQAANWMDPDCTSDGPEEER